MEDLFDSSLTYPHAFLNMKRLVKSHCAFEEKSKKRRIIIQLGYMHTQCLTISRNHTQLYDRPASQ